MKSFLLFTLFSFFLFNGNAQNEETEPIRLHGKLIKKEWSKSTESYCAQGSEYYILEVNNTERRVILQFDESILNTKDFENEKVIVVGQHTKKTISQEQENGETEQHPVQQVKLSSDEEDNVYTCHIFEVEIITLER